MQNPYLRLTDELNEGRLRALLSSGQAVVLYRLAVMSKDGDWILRENAEATGHVLRVLEGHGAAYRFGAPLDIRWLRHGWSSHFEYRDGPLRIRCDFVTRPPRISDEVLGLQWGAPVELEVPVVSLEVLADLKKTNREKDYAVIGELARRMESTRSRLLHSRSARDLIELAELHPEETEACVAQRPLLSEIPRGRDALERALDEERRTLIRANEARLERYLASAEPWAARWRSVARSLEGLPLREAHEAMTAAAEGILPWEP